MKASDVMQYYKETRGTLVKKYRNLFGQYVFVLSENGRKTKICVGKALFESTEIGTEWTMGHMKKKLINVRPGIRTSTDEIEKLWKLSLQDIWNIADKNQFVIAMSGWLDRKCKGGANPAVLSPEEKAVYVVDSFQSEVNNGGFSQYLYNGSGSLAGELLASLAAIGADCTAEIYRDVLSLLPPELPADELLRNELLDEVITADISAVMSTADDRFYTYPDDLEELLYRFIMNHKSCFAEAESAEA